MYDKMYVYNFEINHLPPRFTHLDGLRVLVPEARGGVDPREEERPQDSDEEEGEDGPGLLFISCVGLYFGLV